MIDFIPIINDMSIGFSTFRRTPSIPSAWGINSIFAAWEPSNEYTEYCASLPIYKELFDNTSITFPQIGYFFWFPAFLIVHPSRPDELLRWMQADINMFRAPESISPIRFLPCIKSCSDPMDLIHHKAVHFYSLFSSRFQHLWSPEVKLVCRTGFVILIENGHKYTIVIIFICLRINNGGLEIEAELWCKKTLIEIY